MSTPCKREEELSGRGKRPEGKCPDPSCPSSTKGGGVRSREFCPGWVSFFNINESYTRDQKQRKIC